MFDMGLSSQQVLAFIPSNTWTPVFLISGCKSNNEGTYLITTYENYLKRCQDMYEMALKSFSFEKVGMYQLMGFVAVEIEGLWFRGRMLSYNEYLTENTIVKLIDSGSTVKKQLCDLFKLPDCFKYDPLCLAIKPVNTIDNLKMRKFYVQPLLLQSELQKGFVVVNTKPIDEIDELHSEINIKDNTSFPLSVNGNSSSTTKTHGNFVQGYSDPQKSNKFNDILNAIEKQEDQGFECQNTSKLSNELKKAGNNHSHLVNEDIVVSSIDTSVKKDLGVSKHNLLKNGSSVEFVFGTNIDFVYIRSYEEKKKYTDVMKLFYSYYRNKSNWEVQTNVNIGDLVAVCLSHYNEIHRAVIVDTNKISNSGYHLYLCFFVDLGCKEYVNANNIFHLLDETKNIPYLAYKVGLMNGPFNNTIQLKYLKNYFDKLYLEPLIIEFDECDPDGLNKVVLKKKSNKVNIFLEAKDFIRKTLSNLNLTNNEEIEPTLSEYLCYNDLFKNGTRVIITHFFSIKHMYVRINTSELATFYNKIMTEVNQYFVNLKGVYQNRVPKIGDKVAVKSSSKNLFVRATVYKKVNDTSYSVIYVDYGDKDIIKTVDMFVLPYRFRLLPQTVIKVGLNIVWPLNAKKKIPQYFNHLIESSVPLIAEFDEENPFGFQQIVLRNESTGVNINEEICDLPE